MATDETWFYDNDLAPGSSAPNLIRVERVYGLSFDTFSEMDWQQLAEVYQNLPRWLGYGADGCPRWFGADEEAPPYLWASVEPAGLQVRGVLSAEAWEEWDAGFRQSAVALPKREVR